MREEKWKLIKLLVEGRNLPEANFKFIKKQKSAARKLIRAAQNYFD